MMRVLDGEQVLMRIFIGESDQHDNQPLYQALLELFRGEGIAGATVLRGIAGYGARSVLHTTHLLRLSQDLPIVVEAVDAQASFDALMPRLDEMIGGGLITLEKVRVLKYGPPTADPG